MQIKIGSVSIKVRIPGDHLGAELIRVGGNDRDRQLNQVLQHFHADNADNNDGVKVMLLRNIVGIFVFIRRDDLAQIVPVVVEEEVEHAVQRLLV